MTRAHLRPADVCGEEVDAEVKEDGLSEREETEAWADDPMGDDDDEEAMGEEDTSLAKDDVWLGVLGCILRSVTTAL